MKITRTFSITHLTTPALIPIGDLSAWTLYVESAVGNYTVKIRGDSAGVHTCLLATVAGAAATITNPPQASPQELKAPLVGALLAVDVAVVVGNAVSGRLVGEKL